MGLLFGKSGVDDVSIPMIDLADKLRKSRRRVSFNGSCVAAEGVCAALGSLESSLALEQTATAMATVGPSAHPAWWQHLGRSDMYHQYG